MANSDKNIVITPNISSASADPKIVFSGANASVSAQNITLQVYPTNSGTLSFEGSAGQLFSITNNLTGTIFSVNDVSGIPSIAVQDSGIITLAQYAGNVLVGTGTDSSTGKLQVSGQIAATTVSTSGTVTGGNLATSGTVSATGTVTGSAFYGSASGLSNIPGANVTGTVASATTATNQSGGTVNATTGSFTGLITGATSASTDVNTANDAGSFSFRGNTTTVASCSFHRAGAYAINMGLGTDNVFRIGGWSASSNCMQLTGAGSMTILGTMTVNSLGGATALSNAGTSGVGNIGASGAAFNTVFAKSTSAQYADLAENYVSDSEYEPGTVVVFGGTEEITTTTLSHDTRVAGVISTNPAYLMNSDAVGLPVALTGRVPCRVQGPVNKGDVLVTSELAGVAQRIDNTKFAPGCVIGKALEDLDNTQSIIEVVVGRF